MQVDLFIAMAHQNFLNIYKQSVRKVAGIISIPDHRILSGLKHF